ncbi:uncharacterized protein LOC125501302 [Athalia rosae]|uniref:uncharacterized protein LOC125501302 n=1 Tax=Athalia rosae TaxID=37344 RepID=UPI0020333774|nr:uncharacterized protein LOC125501302 [Athalia rosae]
MRTPSPQRPICRARSKWMLRNVAQFSKLNMATQKITLYDSKRDILVETYVSPADAERATTDIVFATELLRRAVNQDSQPSTSTDADCMSYDLNSDDINASFIDEEALDTEATVDVNSETQESEVSLYRWSPPCVLLLLETYRSMEETFIVAKSPKKKCGRK